MIADPALLDPDLDGDRHRPDEQADALLVGAVDLHQHPGPSPFPRRMGIMDAARDAAGAGFRAIVAKSHHHSMVTDILALGPAGLDDLPVEVRGGIALNRTVGGLNPYACSPNASEQSVPYGRRAAGGVTILAPEGDEGSRAAVAHQWRSAAAIVAAGMAVLCAGCHCRTPGRTRRPERHSAGMVDLAGRRRRH